MIQIVFFGFVLLFLRTMAFHLQQWQIREYRWDRLKDHLFNSAEGHRKVWSFWFFPGIFPRPKLSGRLVFILLIWSFLSFFAFYYLTAFFQLSIDIPLTGLLLILVLFERTLWFTVAVSVFLSSVPANILKNRLFLKAKTMMACYDENIIRIGITGSYGKSSTKEILVHLLISHFGSENVLYNPRNDNNEVAIARLILRSKQFFMRTSKTPKFMVIEMGAYSRGEISKMCDFVRPHVSILTGVNNQHISLFGSQKNIQKAKFELAEWTRDTVFFNANSPLLSEIFSDTDIQAVKIPVSVSSVHNIKAHPYKTEFEVYGQKMTLPWMGEFFVTNAFLCLELVRELGIKPSEMALYLNTLPSLERSLHSRKLNSGALLISDPYSANMDGVLQAIEQLRLCKGKRIFVGIPLIELGYTAEESHTLIFQKLKELGVLVFWLKKDYSTLGKNICGDLFYGHNLDEFRKIVSELKSDDGVLLESRLPQKFLDFLK